MRSLLIIISFCSYSLLLQAQTYIDKKGVERLDSKRFESIEGKEYIREDGVHIIYYFGTNELNENIPPYGIIRI